MIHFVQIISKYCRPMAQVVGHPNDRFPNDLDTIFQIRVKMNRILTLPNKDVKYYRVDIEDFRVYIFALKETFFHLVLDPTDNPKKALCLFEAIKEEYFIQFQIEDDNFTSYEYEIKQRMNDLDFPQNAQLVEEHLSLIEDVNWKSLDSEPYQLTYNEQKYVEMGDKVVKVFEYWKERWHAHYEKGNVRRFGYTLVLLYFIKRIFFF